METLNITIKLANGKVIKADLYNDTFPTSSPLFQFFEEMFNNWFDSRKENDRDLEEMYFGEEAIYTKMGAIEQAIETFEEIVLEGNNRTFTEKQVRNMDIESAFE